MKNPKFSRDELILVLDFYKKYHPSIPGKTSKQIAELSQTLNELASFIDGEKPDKFRNPNGVYMKLMNFRRFDPSYTGRGLERGGKDEEVVWNLYANDPKKLRDAASAIRSFVTTTPSEAPLPKSTDEGLEEADEGRLLTRVHTSRERNRKLVEGKKKKSLDENGRLSCEACGFDFELAYGERGAGFIECHHTKPVSELKPGEKTSVRDLAVVCSNCHRMIHRKRPWLTIAELKCIIAEASTDRSD